MHTTIPRVYIAGRYSTDNVTQKYANVQTAWLWSRIVASVGAMPYNPISNTAFLDESGTVEWWYEATGQMLDLCHAILLMPGWQDSKGACAEKARAEKLGLKVFDSANKGLFAELDMFVAGFSQ